MKEEKIEVNQHILNIISPPGVDFVDAFNANLGESVGRMFAITKYPAEVDYGWLAPLCNLEGTTTQIEYEYAEAANMIEVFDKKINNLGGDLDVAQTESEKQRIRKAIEDLRKMINKININGEPIGYVNILLHVQASNIKELEKRIKKVSGVVAVSGCNIFNLRFRQNEALHCIAPYGIPHEKVKNVGSRNMPISTFTGGFPMANPGISDIGGNYLGITKGGKLIILNMWIRGKDRVNSNWFVSGVPGTGKSTAIKLITSLDYARGTKIIMLDPEHEYVDLVNTEEIDGEVVKGSGGKYGRINPLQVRHVPKVTKEDLLPGEKLEDFMQYDEEEQSELALHIQSLRVFFKLYFGEKNFDASIKTKLEKCLIETYESKGITWDTDISTIKNEEFPIIENVYDLVEKKKVDLDISSYDREGYSKLSDLLYSAAKGADKFIWNGTTTLNPQKDFIDIDCSDLLELDENVKRAQFFNLTSWCWHQMSKDRTEKVLLGVDEGYLFIDPENKDLMKFMRNISKRDRKYEGGLMFITHSAVDVLDPEVKRFGQAIIDNSCYKFVMGCDGKNLEETAKLFSLTEKEKNILNSKNRGQGILFAGSVRLEMRLEVSDYFLDLFGKAGGR